MIVDTERIWGETPVYERNKNILLWKEEIQNYMEKVKKTYSQEQKEILKMVNILLEFMTQNKQLIILEADKGRKTVIL